MFRQGGETTAINSAGRKKIHTTFPDGSELVEEYDLKTGELQVRKRRAKRYVSGQGNWEYLYGDPPQEPSKEAGFLESSVNPILTRRDTQGAFQWRIRNLPYPKEVYSLSIDASEQKIVVRTSNKKYYKRFGVPELELLSLPLDEDNLTFTHSNNTLIIAYAKPAEVIAAELVDLAELKKLRAQEDGDVDCKQQ